MPQTAHVGTGSWSWLKEWSGYIVTILPYISSALVLLPAVQQPVKFAVLAFFAIFVLAVRVLHERAGIEVTAKPERQKYPELR